MNTKSEIIKNQIRKYFLIIIVIGLTIISLLSGFDFYKSLFDLTTAILCCTIFEIIRLNCLWSFVSNEWKNKMITIPIYIVIVSICSFAAITNFHAMIIEKHKQLLTPYNEELMNRISLIKKEYVKRTNEKLNVINGKIDVCKRKLAWNKESHYWSNRLEQLINEKQYIEDQQNIFLNEKLKDNKEEWIERYVSLLGMDCTLLVKLKQRSENPTTSAIQELWGLSLISTKKIISIVIVMISEMGILLLSLLTKEKVQIISSNNKIINKLREKFDNIEIKRFIKKSIQSYQENGRLPLIRDLGRKQREIRKYFDECNFSKDEIEEFMNSITLKS